MKQFRLNIGQEIFLALSLTVVMTLAVTALSISFLQQISNEMVSLAERNQALESAALQLRISVEQQNDSIRRFTTWIASNPNIALNELPFCQGNQSVRGFLIIGGDPRLVSYNVAQRGYTGALAQLNMLVTDTDNQQALERISNRYTGFTTAAETHLMTLCLGRPPDSSSYWQWPEGQQSKDILATEVDSLIAGLRRQISNQTIANQERARSILALTLGLATVALVGGTAAGFTISRSLTRSVRRLVMTAQTIKRGNLSIQVEPSGPEELLLLAQTVNDMAASLDRSHRRLEQALSDLEQSEAKYRMLTEEATDIVFTVASGGTVTFVNQRIEAVAGYRSDEVIGQPLSQFLACSEHNRDLGRLVADLEQAESPETFEVSIRTKDNGIAYLEVNAMPITEDGQINGYRGIARDVTEKIRLEQEISRRNRELRLSQERQSELQTYVGLVTQAVEEERKRLARELHDDTAQSLVVLAHRLDSIREELRNSPGVVDNRLEDLQLLADQILDAVRRFCRDLRPAVLDDLGLLAALEWLLNDFNQNSSIPTQLVINGQPRRLSPDAEVGLFRTAQEALNNVNKHAQATKVLVQLSFGEVSVRLAVIDNGRGFIVGEESSPVWVSTQHMGLMGMRERAELLGGTLQIDSKLSTGTAVSVELPE